MLKRPFLRSALALAGAATLAACAGTIEPHSGDDPNGAPTGGRGEARARPGTTAPVEPPRARECRSTGAAPAPAPLARLTSVEYRNTVRDLFAGIEIPVPELPRDDTLLGFDGLARAQNPVPAQVEAFEKAARSIGESAASQAAKLLPCGSKSGADEGTCARRWLEGFARRAFRRPLPPAELERYTKILEATRAAGGLGEAVSITVQILLQSPHFLYRPELGAPVAGRADLAALSGHEMASRLSYLLWDTMPDGALFAAADAGKLGTAAQIEAEARRMLADPRARPAVAHFHRQWLRLTKVDGINKDGKVFPAWNARLPALLRESTERFVDSVFWEKRSLESLFTDTRAYVNKDLAPLYGVSATSTELAAVTLPPSERSGILTQAGVLAPLGHPTLGSPVQRGLFVLDRFFCVHIPDPPPEVNAEPPQPSKTMPATTRQLFGKHSGPECVGCHAQIDGVGFALENYDSLGQWRTRENGVDVDARSTLVGLGDVDGPISGAIDLGRRMGRSREVSACVARHWLGYATGVETRDVPDCAIAALTDEFVKSGFDLEALLIGMVKSDSFRLRPAPTP